MRRFEATIVAPPLELRGKRIVVAGKRLAICVTTNTHGGVLSSNVNGNCGSGKRALIYVLSLTPRRAPTR